MKNILIAGIVGVLVVGGASFYGGTKYQASKNPFGNRQPFGQMGADVNGMQARNGSGTRQGMNPINGDIISRDDKSITVKLRDGGSKIVFLSDSTEISKFASGSAGDLEVGKLVMVSGKTGTDGSVTAQTIQLRPMMAAPQGR